MNLNEKLNEIETDICLFRTTVYEVFTHMKYLIKELEKENEQLKTEIKIHTKGNSKILAKSCSLSYENEQMKSQIEKMKCCGNCTYYLFKYINNINICEFDLHDCSNCELKETDYDYKCDKWELAE